MPARKSGKPDPWEYERYGQKYRHMHAYDRIAIINHTADPTQLQAMIDWPDTQNTVRKAAGRRIRKLKRRTNDN